MILSSGRPLIFSSGEVDQTRFSGQTQTVGENDPVRRRAAIDEIFHEDAVFYDPQGGIYRGPDEIDRSNQFPKLLESAVTAAPAILLFRCRKVSPRITAAATAARRIKRGLAWNCSTLLHQRGSALADFLEPQFKAPKLLRT